MHGNEGMDVEMASKISVRSPGGLVNGEGLGHITDLSYGSSCREIDQENGVGWRWVNRGRAFRFRFSA